MSNFKTSYVINHLPLMDNPEELIKFDIYFSHTKNTKQFVRVIHPFDLIGLSEETMIKVKDCKHCEIEFIEIDARVIRRKYFLADFQIISTLN